LLCYSLILHEESYSNRLIAKAKLLDDAVKNFHSSVDEIAIAANVQGVRLKTYYSEAHHPSRAPFDCIS
jgi:hypothetical protein